MYLVMCRDRVLLRTPFREIRLHRREHARGVEPSSYLSPALLAPDLDGWFANTVTRKALLEFAGVRDRLHTDGVVERARAWLERALDRGHVIAVESRARRVVLPVNGAAESLGPEEPAPLSDDFLWTLLFDSSGAPMADALGVTFDVFESGRSKARFENIRLQGGGGGVAALPEGGPRSFDVRFTVPDDAVPAEADPVGPPRLARANVKTNGPVTDPVLVTRRELARTKQSAGLDVNNVYQLRRREAEVIEFEHFHDGSAVLLPDQTPESVYRPEVTERPRGIDVLKACLALAQDFSLDEMVVTGHDAILSQQRADAVRALLVGDNAARTTWVQVAMTTGVDADIRAILKWAAQAFGWDSDPDATQNRTISAALQEFKIGYNRDARDGLFAGVSPDFPLLEDGVFDRATWGAVFDCYLRGVRPASATSLPDWARKLDIGGEETRVGKNAKRPQRVSPYIVLGKNGPGNEPITIAQVGGGDPNLAFGVFQDLNPQYHVGAEPEFVGQALNVPPEWVGNLRDPSLRNGPYTVLRDPFPPTPPTNDVPPPLESPGPQAVGCGAHHLVAPFAGAENRRALRRHAEVVFFDEPAPTEFCGPSTPDPCRASVCQLYDPREYALEYRSPHAGPVEQTFAIFLDTFLGPIEPEKLYVLSSTDGSYRQERHAIEAVPVTRTLFRLVFTDVRGGRHYNLHKVLTPGSQVAIFEDVPYQALSGPGRPTPTPRPLEGRQGLPLPGQDA